MEGFDAAGKVVIMANLLMGAIADAERMSIARASRRLTPDDIAAAKAAGERWKLIGRVETIGDKVAASVRPTRLPVTSSAGLGQRRDQCDHLLPPICWAT